MVHQWDFVTDGPSLKLMVHWINECTKMTNGFASQERARAQPHCSKAHKNQVWLSNDQFEENPVCSSLNFLMEQEDSNNVMKNSRDQSCIALRYAIWDLIDQKIIAPSSLGGQFNLAFAKWSPPQAPKLRSHPWDFQSFFCLSLLCLLIWIHRHMLVRFWLWTHHSTTYTCKAIEQFVTICCQTKLYKEWSPICLKETNNYARSRV